MNFRTKIYLCIILCKVLCFEYVVVEAICEITRKSTNANIYPGAGNYSTGKKVHFSCDSGLMFGERSLTCLDSSEWDSKITYCAGCPALTSFENGKVNYTYTPFELVEMEEGKLFPNTSTASLKCNDGYYLTGPEIVTCLYATWTPKSTCLPVVCEALSLDNGVVNYNKPHVHGGYSIGVEAYITCNPGYVSSGPQSTVCQISGAWSSQIACTSIKTCAPLSLANGMIGYSNFSVHGRYVPGTEASFSCNCRYAQSGPSLRICQTSGKWSLEDTTCDPIYCEALTLFNGKITYDKLPDLCCNYHIDTEASILCNDGYSQFGPSSSTCEIDGSWTSQTTCELSCTALTTMDFGQIVYNKLPSLFDGTYPLGTMAIFKCNHGYTAEGPQFRTCQRSGLWNKGNQTCKLTST